MKRLALIFILCFICQSMSALDVIFRYDDFVLEEDEFQLSLINLFDEMDVPLHIAVIPCRADSTYIVQEGRFLERVKELHRKGILQVALHGFCHDGETVYGEFLSKDYAEQRYCLTRGDAFLNSVFEADIHIFIPPWNRYNQDTQNILSVLGYNIISADIADLRFTSDTRFQYFPESVDHPSKLLAVIKHNSSREGLIVCMFHRYDINDSFTLNDLRDVLLQVKDIVNITTMDEVYEHSNDYDGDRLIANSKHPLVTKILHTRPIIMTRSDVIRLRLFDIICHAAFFVIISLLIMSISGRFNRRVVVFPAFIIAVSLLCVWCQWLMPRRAFVFCSVAIVLASLVSVLFVRKL